jgi:hypothetical protein
MGFENIVYGCILKIRGISGFVLKVGYTDRDLEKRMKELNNELPVEVNRNGEKMNYELFHINMGRNSRDVEKFIHDRSQEKFENGIDYNGSKKTEYYHGCENVRIFKSVILPIIKKTKEFYFSQPQIAEDTMWEETYSLENYDRIYEDEVPTDIESESESEYQTEDPSWSEDEWRTTESGSESESEYQTEDPSWSEDEWRTTESGSESESEDEEYHPSYKRKASNQTIASRIKRGRR